MNLQNSYICINYLHALEVACHNCGDKHRNDCPIWMAKIQINSTKSLFIEFYKNL